MGSEVRRPGSNPGSSLCGGGTWSRHLSESGFLLCNNDTKLFGLLGRLERDNAWQAHRTQREACFGVFVVTEAHGFGGRKQGHLWKGASEGQWYCWNVYSSM